MALSRLLPRLQPRPEPVAEPVDDEPVDATSRRASQAVPLPVRPPHARARRRRAR